MKTLKRVLIMWFAVTGAWTSFAQDGDRAPRYRVVMPDEVERFLMQEVFQTDEMKWAASTPGTSVHALLQKIKKRPLFTMPMPADHRAVSNHPAYYGVLVVRPYEAKFVGDLYHLHELFHIATMPYRPDDTYAEWAAKMIDNEKDASLYTEAMVYFEFPYWRRLFPLPNIWVDRFLGESGQAQLVVQGKDNRAAYIESPDRFRNSLKAIFVKIGKRSYESLDGAERRSWLYDRWNTIFTMTFAPSYQEIETRMFNFSKNWSAGLGGQHGAWLQIHQEWLEEMTNQAGVLNAVLADEFLEYHQVLDTLDQNPTLRNLGDALATQADHLQRLQDATIGITSTDDAIRLLGTFGVTGTVYSVPFQETENLWTQTVSGVPGGMFPALISDTARPGAASSTFGFLYSGSFLKRQDVMHQGFLGGYRRWSKPVLQGLSGFKYAYPTAGSIEAIKDTLGLLKSRNPNLTIHVFKGEYEGVIALAAALSISVVQHERNTPTAEILSRIAKGDFFYITQPSSLDGNLWNPRGVDGGYDAFMEALNAKGVSAIVDLAYVGTVARPYQIRVDHPNIKYVLFSLSKAFGVYYQRIGGVFCREENPLLKGHVWFKNVLAMVIGTKLMETYAVQELPRRYLWAQTQAVARLRALTSIPFMQSDVLLLAHTSKGAVSTDMLSGSLAPFKTLDRNGILRPALSPMIELLERGTRNLRPQCELYFRTVGAR